MTEREKMLAGALYDASDAELVAMRRRSRDLVRRYNGLSEEEPDERRGVLERLLGHVGAGVEVVPPFQVDYGDFVTLGRGVFLNFGCILLDTCPITIGAGTLVGPGVHFYAATHPVDPAVRRSGLEMGAPITVGENVWIGGASVILPGVTIGDDTTIGAGSVVTKDVPAGVVAVGNPCRVVRAL